MIELIKKGVLLGLGVLAMTKEKAEEITDELIQKGQATKENRHQLIDDLLSRAKKLETDLESLINKQIKITIEKLGIPTKKDFDDLKKKIDTLIKKIEKK